MAGEIQIMIPQYGELNRIYNDFLISHTFSFDRQKFITDFYKQYNNTKAFEAAILELVLDKPKEQYTLSPQQPENRDREKHIDLRKTSIV